MEVPVLKAGKPRADNVVRGGITIKCKSSGYDIKANYMGSEFHLRWVYTDKTGMEFLDKMKEAYIRGDTIFKV